MTEHDDITLIRRCLSGDREAFAVLIERYQKPIYAVALRMLNNSQEAEDVAQNVFLKAYENLHRFQRKYKFFSWIYRMAINESLNMISRVKRFEPLDLHTLSREQLPDDALESTELTQQVERALLHLEPELRAIIILKHFHALSYREIGYIMDMQEKTVKWKLYDARQVLRNILIKQGLVH